LTTIGTDQASRDSFSREREHVHWSADRELLSAGTSHHLPSGTDPISHDISRHVPRSQDLPISSTPYWPPHWQSSMRADPSSSLEAQYGSSGTRSLLTVDDVSVSVTNIQPSIGIDTQLNVALTPSYADVHVASSSMTTVNVDDMRAVVSNVCIPADPEVLPARTRTQQRDSDICGYSRPLYAAAVAPHTPLPSSVSAASDAALSDLDSDYPAAGQNARRSRSRRSVACTSHHSDAMQLAATLADALKDQLKQACERQERLDRERAAAQQLHSRNVLLPWIGKNATMYVLSVSVLPH